MLMSTNSVFYDISLILRRVSLGLSDEMGGVAARQPREAKINYEAHLFLPFHYDQSGKY